MSDFKCEEYTWEQTYELAKKAVAKMQKDKYVPDVIIGITRGGWVPSMMISDLTGIRDLLSLRVEHWTETASKDQKAVLKYPLQTSLKGKKVLLIDDLTDTGDSLILALEDLKKNGPLEVRTATLVHKTQSKIKPDYFAKQVNKWVWIVFPWNLTEDHVKLTRKVVGGDKKITAAMVQRRLKQRFNLKADQKLIKEILKKKDRVWI